MSEPNSAQVNRRRRRERFWVAVVFGLILALGSLEGWFFQFQPDLPLYSNISLFALINFNVILLLLLAYLVLRNVVKLVFERRHNLLGHKLRTRLLIAFMGLAIIPTLPLFWLATQFISSSLDYWFTQQVEQPLEESVQLARAYLKNQQDALLRERELVKNEVLRYLEEPPSVRPSLESGLTSILRHYHLDAIFFFDSARDLRWGTTTPDAPAIDMAKVIASIAPRQSSAAAVQSFVQQDKREGLIAYISLAPSDGVTLEHSGTVIILRFLPVSMTDKLTTITDGYEDYLQLKLLHSPLKSSHFITFSIVTLLVLFAAVWFAFFLAKSLTIPIQSLVAATRRIAEGDLNVQLESVRDDEIGMLISSFNKMVRDLRNGREQLANAYLALWQNHTELEGRRRYMEIVLRDVAAAVVSIDAKGKIVTINKSAEATFGLDAGQTRGRPYWEVVKPAQLEIVQSFIAEYRTNRPNYLQRKVSVMLDNRAMILLIKVSILHDDRQRYMGIVIVIDDLTDLEKAQRMAAWREVARRIAHEIKNPLTPIQLSAQRLRRKYENLLHEQESVFEVCTRTIIQQVEHMKHLVNEFSNFARLPRAQLLPCNFPLLVEETLALYRHTYPQISLVLAKNGDFPLLMLDRDQMKQVLLNLLDNAIHAMDGDPGTIRVQLGYDPDLQIARLECADTGHGLSAEDKLRMFEPYYSTKEKGTGLGLTIVASIIADHNGFVRVRDNTPEGTVIVIELPG